MKRQHGRKGMQIVLILSFVVLVCTFHMMERRVASVATQTAHTAGFAVHEGSLVVECTQWSSRQLGQCLAECSAQKACHGISWSSTLQQFEATVADKLLPVRTIKEQGTEEGRCCFTASQRPQLVPANPMAQSYLPKSFLKLGEPEGTRPHGDALRQDIHFAVLTSIGYLHSRMIPALNTWLRGMKATAFVDSNSASDPRDRRLYVEQLQQLLELSPETSLQIAFMNLAECHSGASFDPRRLSSNGAWKPLFIVLAFSLLKVHPDVSWLMLVDDDTYILTSNLVKHLRSFPLGQRTVYGCVFKYGTLFEGGSTSLCSNGTLGSKDSHDKKRFLSVEYAQGGGGILFSQLAMATLADALRLLDLASAECVDSSVQGAGQCGESMDTVVLEVYHRGNSSIETVYSLNLRRGFADEWPAGDMRVAWLLHQWNAHSLSSARRVALRHHPSFFHRTLGLTLGADRKHVRSAFPLSFHRLRQPSDVQDIHSIVTRATDGVSPLDGVSWRVLEGLLAEVWKLKLQNCEGTSHTNRRQCDEMIRKYFFDDEGQV